VAHQSGNCAQRNQSQRDPGVAGENQREEERDGRQHQKIDAQPADQLVRDVLVAGQRVGAFQMRPDQPVNVEGLTRDADFAAELFARAAVPGKCSI